MKQQTPERTKRLAVVAAAAVILVMVLLIIETFRLLLHKRSAEIGRA